MQKKMFISCSLFFIFVIMLGSHVMGNTEEKHVPLQNTTVKLSDSEDAFLAVTRYQDLKNNTNSYTFVFYTNQNNVLQEIFLNWTENYLTLSGCSEADCLNYLIQRFNISSDSFLIDAVQSFENIADHDTDFAVKRRDFIEFDGMVQVTISPQYKKVNVMKNPEICLISDEDNGILTETQCYDISFEESV